MSLLKIEKHSDVLSTLDLVQDEVDKEARRIFSAGGDALKVGKIKPAKEAISYAEKLEAFVEKLKALGDEWKSLEATIDAAAPEVKEIVLPITPRKSRKVGYKRKVMHVSPKSNFTVKFKDGTEIIASRACDVFAQTIEKMGAKKVANLGVLSGGDPLVTNNKALITKEVSQIIEIANGWFVKTHSSTQAKIDYLKRFAKALKIDIVITKV